LLVYQFKINPQVRFWISRRNEGGAAGLGLLGCNEAENNELKIPKRNE